MEKFIEFAKKFDLKELGFIFAFSLLCFFIFFGKQDAYLVDVGREAYIPWQMLSGKVLYKDIFNVYGPLGYQINALAYMILGIKLDTLYFMGFLNSLIICFSTYFISKLFVPKKLSLAITFLTISVCVYIRTFFNFIFAYSYSAIYALSGFLLSLFSMLLYIKNQKTKYLFLGFLFAGFSFANKIENLPYFILLFISLPFVLKEKKDWKKYIEAFCFFMIFPCISFGILLLQGATVGDFLNALDLINKLVHAPVVEYFYNAYGLYFNPFYIKLSFYYLYRLLFVALPYVLIFFALNFINEKYFENKFLKAFLNVVIFLLTFFVSIKSFDRFLPMSERLFCWLGLCGVICLVILFGVFVCKLIKNKFDFSIISDNQKMFIFLLISAISVSIKGISGITTECYGTFSLAALFIPFVVFFYSYINIPNKTVIEKTIINLCFVIVISYLSANIMRIGEKPLYPVSTQRGTIYVRDMFKSQNDFVHFIKQYTSKDSVIVSVPEGAIINFLSERKSNDLYYYLIPANIQVFGEEKIIFDFKKSPPDYFIMNNVPYSPFNVGDFCDYAKKVCGYIKNNYKPYAAVDDGVRFVLYKRK